MIRTVAAIPGNTTRLLGIVAQGKYITGLTIDNRIPIGCPPAIIKNNKVGHGPLQYKPDASATR